jgi:hypothetical protein
MLDAGYCLLPTAYCLLTTAAYYSPFTVNWLLPTAYCRLLFTACFSPFTVHWLLPTAYCRLLFTGCCRLPIYCLQFNFSKENRHEKNGHDFKTPCHNSFVCIFCLQ